MTKLVDPRCIYNVISNQLLTSVLVYKRVTASDPLRAILSLMRCLCELCVPTDLPEPKCECIRPMVEPIFVLSTLVFVEQLAMVVLKTNIQLNSTEYAAFSALLITCETVTFTSP